MSLPATYPQSKAKMSIANVTVSTAKRGSSDGATGIIGQEWHLVTTRSAIVASLSVVSATCTRELASISTR